MFSFLLFIKHNKKKIWGINKKKKKKIKQAACNDRIWISISVESLWIENWN